MDVVYLVFLAFDHPPFVVSIDVVVGLVVVVLRAVAQVMLAAYTVVLCAKDESLVLLMHFVVIWTWVVVQLDLKKDLKHFSCNRSNSETVMGRGHRGRFLHHLHH